MPKISLAQWSLQKSLFSGQINALDFPEIAREKYEISAVEYVNQFYSDQKGNASYWQKLKARCDQAGVQSLLIMVDDEGDLGNPDEQQRIKAVENHLKWIEAAKILGCHSIRVNAFGTGEKEEVIESLKEGLSSLAKFGAQEEISVLIENHGLLSSDASVMVQIIQEVNNPFLGTLPDFGNWCLSAKWGSTRLNNCQKIYDRYRGVQELLPFAKGVSAKSYDFSEERAQEIIDYHKMLRIVKESGYQGHIGIEYEGENLSEDEGIRATKQLIEKIWLQL